MESEEYYRNLCSSETLRSGKKGFFHDFSSYAVEGAGQLWISKIYGRIGNDEDRVRTLFTDGRIKDLVLETLSHVKSLFRDKDPEISRRRRLEAFELAAAGKHEKALLTMSQAVLRATATGRSKDVDRGFGLALALLGRAEIFMTTKEYHLALEDLRMAGDFDLPSELKSEVARKRKDCEDFVRANELSLLPVSIAREKVRDVGGSARPSGEFPKPTLPQLSGGENPDLPCASRSLSIRDTKEAGKHLVANGKIDPGDVLIVESPLAACLLPEFFGTHCQHCFSRLRAPVGCPDCSSVAFCGRKCRDLALSSYHKYECRILALLIGSGMSILSTLALRMVTQNGPSKSLKIHEALTGQKVRGAEEEKKLSKSAKRRLRKRKLRESRSSDENETSAERDGDENGERNEEEIDARAYDLVMHQERRSANDFFERSLMAAFLLRCLQRVDFFERTSSDDEVPSEEETAVGALLLKNLQLLQFNAHEFYETRLGEEHRFRGSVPLYLGVAIYPTAARFNHDCYPAVSRYFVGRDIVIRASRALSAEDVVAENYGPIFTKRSLAERQRTLAGRYWFRCTCKACREDWPRFENLSNDMVKLRCPTEGCTKLHPRASGGAESTRCSACRREVKLGAALATLEKCEELYAEGFARLDEESPKEAAEILIEAMKKFHQVAEPPHKDTHLAEIALNSCMSDTGNVWRAPVFD